MILDGSQWIGHLPFNLSEELCDILCAPGHKALFGLQGAGFAARAEGAHTERASAHPRARDLP
jgi:selenocysteine lyase/cysteine desulfurase